MESLARCLWLEPFKSLHGMQYVLYGSLVRVAGGERLVLTTSNAEYGFAACDRSKPPPASRSCYVHNSALLGVSDPRRPPEKKCRKRGAARFGTGGFDRPQFEKPPLLPEKNATFLAS